MKRKRLVRTGEICQMGTDIKPRIKVALNALFRHSIFVALFDFNLVIIFR